ncbi:MAG: tetratricopeptide repeat protein [Myxococcota bacterium]
MAPRSTALLLAATVGVLSGPAQWARAQEGEADPVTSYERRLDNLRRSVERLERLYADPVAVIRTHPLETRFVEARVQYDLGHWESASVILMELVDNDAFTRNPEYPEALLMLGRSLLKQGNVKAARGYLERAANAANPEVTDEARFLLIDMALDRGDDEALRDLVRSLSGTASPRTQYAMGKALVRLGEYQRALSVLGGLTTHDELGAKTRYYMGVAQTALGRTEAAQSAFEDLAAAPSDEGVSTDVRDLSRLALGRLHMEAGDLVSAVTAYQRIERHSPHYEVALYEMAWTYIKAEQYDKALGTLDALLLTVKDPELDVEAHTLRGRLNIFLNDYESAVESFDEIVARFAPIRNELERFTRNPDNVHRYFEWLLERQVEEAALNAPLTDRTAEWVESVGDMKQVVEVFDEMSTQRNEIRTTHELAEDLERIVTSRNRVELFPDLKEGWTRAVVLENQLLFLSSQMLDHQNRHLKPNLDASEKAELSELVNWRQRLERRFARLPMTFGQYQERKARVDERFLDLKRKAFLVRQRLKAVRRQLLALERYVDDRQYAEKGEKFSEEREDEIRALLAEEKTRLEELYDDLAGLERELEVEARRIGAGDEATRGEEDLKQALIEAHKREGLFYDRHAADAKPGLVADFDRLGQARDRIFEQVGALDRVVAAIDRKVDAQVRRLRARIERESRKLSGYAATMGTYESQGERIGQRVGEELFDRARQKMKDVVLKAEVGLIDVAWQRKREKTEDIQAMSQEKSDKLRRLDATLQELMTERIRSPLFGGGEGEGAEGGEEETP